jgi:hypothetical protein
MRPVPDRVAAAAATPRRRIGENVMQDAHAIAIQHDWDVYTNDGEHLGTAKTVTDSYVVVEKGRIFKHDLYIPLSSFMEADETEHRGTLSVTSDQIESLDWDQPPSGVPGSAANDLPPATQSSSRLRPQFTNEPGEAAIDTPESAQPSMETEPRPIDTP